MEIKAKDIETTTMVLIALAIKKETNTIECKNILDIIRKLNNLK